MINASIYSIRYKNKSYCMKVLDCLGHQNCQAGGTINFVYAWWKLTTVRDKYRVIHQISGEYINMQNDNFNDKFEKKLFSKSYLDTPSVFAYFSSWISTWSTSLLLDMQAHTPTPAAYGVGLIAPFTKWTGTLRLKLNKYIYIVIDKHE